MSGPAAQEAPPAAASPRLRLELSTPTVVVEEALGEAWSAIPSGRAIEPEDLVLALRPRHVDGLWAGLDVDLAFSIASLLWQEAVFKNAGLSAQLAHGRAAITSLEGALPGGAHATLVALDGFDGAEPGALRADIVLKADYPRPFLDWLGLPVERIAPGTLGALQAGARLQVSRERIALEAGRLALGEAVIEGDGAVRFGDGEIRGDIEAAAQGLDLAILAGVLEPLTKADPRTNTGDDALIRPLMITFSIDGQALRIGERAVTRMGLNGALERRKGDISLALTRIDVADPHGTGLTGTARLFVPAPQDSPDERALAPRGVLDLHLSAVTLTDLLKSLDISPSRQTAVLQGVAGGTGAPVGLQLGGRLEDRRLTGGVNGLLGEMGVSGRANLRLAPGWVSDWPTGGEVVFDLKADDGRAVATLLGLPLPAQPDGAGAANGPTSDDTEGGDGLETDETADVDNAGRLKARILLGEGTGTAELNVDLAGLSGSATADLTLGADPARLDGRLSISTPPLEGAEALGPISFTALLSGTGRSIAFNDLAGRVGDAVIGGDVTVSRPAGALEETDVRSGASTQALALTGDLTLDSVRIDHPARLFGLDQHPSGEGEEKGEWEGEVSWPVAPLDLSWLSGPRGDVTLSIGILTIGDHRLQDVALPLSLRPGRLDANGIRASIGDGVLDAAASIARTKDGAAAVALTAEARDMSVTAAFESADGAADGQSEGEAASPPRLAGQVSGTARLQTSGFSLFDLVSSLAGTVEVNDAVFDLAPLDVAALAQDWPGIETLNAFEEAVIRAAQGDGTRIEGLSGRFVLSEGIARAEGVAGDASGHALTVNGFVNVPARLVDLDVAFALAEDAAPLHLRLSGPPRAVGHHVDASELRYDAALRIKDLKADRITEDDLPPDVLELLRILEEGAEQSEPSPER